MLDAPVSNIAKYTASIFHTTKIDNGKVTRRPRVWPQGLFYNYAADEHWATNVLPFRVCKALFSNSQSHLSRIHSGWWSSRGSKQLAWRILAGDACHTSETMLTAGRFDAANMVDSAFYYLYMEAKKRSCQVRGSHRLIDYSGSMAQRHRVYFACCQREPEVMMTDLERLYEMMLYGLIQPTV